MVKEAVLDSAGQFLMRARDNAIRSIEALYSGRMNDASGKRIGLLAECLPAEAHRILAIAAADSFLTALLSDLEWDRSVELRSAGQSITEVSDGLVGEIFTEQGWISRFSEYEASTDEG